MWRRRLRELMTWAILAFVLAALVAFVWFTHHPDSAVLARAAGWPAVGPWVERFRTHYGYREAEPDAELAEMGETAAFDEQPGTAGSPAPASESGAPASSPSVEPPVRHYPADAPTAPLPDPRPVHVWGAAGDPLRSAPSESAETVARLDAYERLEVLERSGEWVRVETPAGAGWLRADADRGGDRPLGSGRLPTTPVAALSPDDDLLAAARDLLGQNEPVGRLGPYDLFTDLETPGELYHLDRLARGIEPAYVGRYGRRPVDRPREAVLLFATEASYRLFQVRETRLAGLPSGGHAGSGMVALYVGDRRRSEVTATLAHELTHMLNRRAIGPVLPPWLDEGLADDLGSAYVGPAGNIDPSRLGGEKLLRPGSIEYFGAPAALRQLNAAYARQKPSLATLTSLDWNRFVRSDDRGLNYAHAGFFIRYLVDGEEMWS